MMPVELKDILEVVGFTPEEGKEPDLTAIKEHLNKAFIPVNQLDENHEAVKAPLNKAYGKRLKELEILLGKTAKDNGIELAYSELEDKTVEENIKHIFGKVNKQIELSKGSKTEVDKKLQEELERVKKENQDFQQSLEKVNGEFTNFKTEVETRQKNQTINSYKEKLFNGVKLKPGLKDHEKIGFRAIVEQKYNIELGEDGNPVLYDKKENKRVQNPKNISAHLTPEEAVELTAKELDLFETKAHEGQKAPHSASQRVNAAAAPTDQKPARRRHPNAGLVSAT